MSGEIVPVSPKEAVSAAIRFATADGGRSSASSMIFARSLSGRPLALGSDLTLELRGGDRLGGLLADLDIDWEPDFMGAVSEACADQRLRGLDWFTMPPILLGGPQGGGRTHVARRLARAAGVPHMMFDATTWMFTWRCAGPDVPLPLPISTAMVASGCANPVVSVTGVERASMGMIDVLARLLDPSCNSRFVDEGLGAVIDYGAVTWIVQNREKPSDLPHLAHGGGPSGNCPVPEKLAHLLRRVDLQDAGPEHYDLLMVDVLAEVLDDLGRSLSPRINLQQMLDQARRWRDPTMREIYDRLAEIVQLDGEEPPF